VAIELAPGLFGTRRLQLALGLWEPVHEPVAFRASLFLLSFHLLARLAQIDDLNHSTRTALAITASSLEAQYWTRPLHPPHRPESGQWQHTEN
jgi:hypothetical protein